MEWFHTFCSKDNSITIYCYIVLLLFLIAGEILHLLKLFTLIQHSHRKLKSKNKLKCEIVACNNHLSQASYVCTTGGLWVKELGEGYVSLLYRDVWQDGPWTSPLGVWPIEFFNRLLLD
jgi:hypothetical protein